MGTRSRLRGEGARCKSGLVIVIALAVMGSVPSRADATRVGEALALAREATGRGDAKAAADILAGAWQHLLPDPAVPVDDKVRLADALVSRLMDAQRFGEAEAVGRAGLALLAEVKDARVAAEAASVFPAPLTRLGKSAEAERLFRDAERWRLKVAGDTRALQMANAQRLAVALALQGKLPDAAAILAPLVPLALAGDVPDPVRALVIPQTLAGLLILQGRPGEAVPILEAIKPRALALWTSPRQEAEFLESLGEAYRMSGQNAEAREAYREGLAALAAGKPGTTATEATLNANLARVLLLLGDPAGAAAHSDASLRLIRARADAARKPDGTLPAQDAQLLRGVVALNLDARFANGDRGAAASPSPADGETFARIQEALALAQPETVARLGAPGTVDLATLRARLRRDEVLMLILPGTDAIHVMGVTRGGFAWNRVARPSYEFCPAVAALRAGLAPGQPLRCLESRGEQLPTGFEPARAHALWQELFAPLDPAVRDKTRWIIASAGVASALPLGVLVMAPPGDADYASLKWLGREKALSFLPLPADLVRVRTAGERPRADALVGFGAPCTGAMAGDACGRVAELGRNASLGALPSGFSLVRSAPHGATAADAEAIAALPALPAAARELEALARVSPGRARIATGRAATEAAVRAATVPPGATLAFATHGLHAGAFGLAEPSLVLTPPPLPTEDDDGLLTASEVGRLSLPDAFVILSACNTAGVRSIEALDPYAGFARAFFKAGARTLLATQFEVPDDGAARLTVATLANLERNPRGGKAEALRKAIDDLLDDPAAAALHHPRAWGALLLVGSPD